MGIQSFSGSSSALPGQTFIDQVYMVFKVRKWARGGSPGFYRATSALGKDGFIYYLQTNGQLIQAPLNGIADVTLPFTEIRILATQYDMISLFKVSAKGTDSLSLTANYTTITSSGLYAFPTNSVGFCDFMAVGAGGGAYHHSSGGGGGGIVYATSIPMPVGQTIAATIGAYPSAGGTSSGNQSQGGSTTFLGISAIGGGGSRDNGTGNNGGNGGGGGHGSSQAGPFAGGLPVQGAQVLADTSQSTYTSTIGNSLSIPLLNQSVTHEAGHAGGSGTGSGHGGGGGGGAGGVGFSTGDGNPVQGGPAKQITYGPITNYYSAGGGSARHSTQNNGPGGGTHWSNAAGHYGMGGDSDHNGVTPGTGGVLIVRTWSV